MASNAYTEDDPLKIDLKTIVDHFDSEDDDVRQYQVRYWKRLKYYWNNFSQIFWSGQDGDYKIWGRDDIGGEGGDQSYYDRPVNVFKAFLETIIAALSTQVPSISCVPDDADNPLDISTAKAGNIISKLIYKQNDAILLWLQMLYIYCTEGMIAVHTYAYEHEKNGTYDVHDYQDEDVTDYFCPECETALDEGMVIQSKLIQSSLADEFEPSADSIKLQQEQVKGENQVPEGSPVEALVCPNCSASIDPSLQRTTLKIPKLIGVSKKIKSRIAIDIYGGLYVKIANYARKQEDTPYLELSFETNYVNALEEYNDLEDKLPQGGWSNTGVNDPYEQYARLNVQYRNDYPRDLITCKHMWLRPAAYRVLPKEQAAKIRAKYPKGVKVIIVNNIVAEVCVELLDDHWTLSRNPMSDYLTHQPLGELLTNIQDIVNDLISLTLQTIEHGIETTWVDPAVVNVNEYGQVEANPGNITATKAVAANRNISEAFYTGKTATLSAEVFSFYRIINELGQFVSGALPSIFGGAMPGSGETAAEYQMSQQMALQRLQTPWKMLTVLWKTVMGKAIPQYMKLLVEDERMVEKDEQGNFMNVFIRKSELGGKIGDVTLDSSDQLPVTEAQQRDIIMKLMELNNMEVFNALTASENLPFIRKIVRIPEFKLPGEADRQKQLEEIQELINTVPIPTGGSIDPTSGMPIESGFTTSVPIDPIVDNHKEEADICRSWLVSDAGRLAKKENPEGYMNVMLHFQAHITEMNKLMRIQQMQAAAMGGSNEDSSTVKQPAGKQNKTPKTTETGAV